MNFDTFILSFLPYALRRITLFSLMQVIMSPLKTLYSLFVTWKLEQTIKQAGTPQVIMLQKMAHDQLGLNIDIEEDTGLSNDFLVKVASQELDKERQLVALISKYKQAGKSFLLNNSAVAFTQTWGDYVCELAAFTQVWSGYVCENLLKTVNLFYKYNGDAYSGVILVASDFLPVSMYLVATFIDSATNEERTDTFHINITVNDTVMAYYSYSRPKSSTEYIDHVALSQASDGTYDYTLTKTT